LDLQGTHGKKITVIPAPVFNATIGRIHQIDPVRRGVESFQKTFQASAGVPAEIHELRQQAVNAGFTRSEFIMQRLGSVGKQLHKDEQESTWVDALNGHLNSGQTINVGGKEVDAAQFWTNEVAHLEHGILGTTSGNVPISAKELNAMMPPGFKGKFKSVKGHVDVRGSLKEWED
jgi:hypothetical protein